MNIDHDNYIALICEGKCEENILNMLLDQELLIFDRTRLIDEKVLSGQFRNATKFTQKYLTFGFENPITIILVLDKSQKLNINKNYQHQVKEQILVITRPEIEMLMIVAKGLYNEFQKVKSNKKPSEFLAEEFKKTKIKSSKFIHEFYNEYDLVDAIKEYHSLRPNKNEYTLNDLLN